MVIHGLFVDIKVTLTSVDTQTQGEVGGESGFLWIIQGYSDTG